MLGGVEEKLRRRLLFVVLALDGLSLGNRVGVVLRQRRERRSDTTLSEIERRKRGVERTVYVQRIVRVPDRKAGGREENLIRDLRTKISYRRVSVQDVGCAALRARADNSLWTTDAGHCYPPKSNCPGVCRSTRSAATSKKDFDMQIDVTPEFLASQGLSPTFPERFWKKVNQNGAVPAHCPELGPCWVWTAAKYDNGYGEIGKWKEKDSPLGAHIASWLLHCGPIPSGMCVCHKCDNRLCVRPSHLRLGTDKDNSDDKMRKGRFVLGKRHHGEDHCRAKLKDDQVREIRELYSGGAITQKTLALKFGVSQSAIAWIVHGQHWKHI